MNKGPIAFPDFYTVGERLRVHILNDGANDSNRAMEAARRVDELEWMVVRCRALEGSSVALASPATEESGYQLRVAILELRILTEAFYQSAWRLISLLDHVDEPVKGVRDLKKRCLGVLSVRNKLVEHPEGKDSRIFDQSFSYGDPEGPKIKPIRAPVTTNSTHGLEFADPTQHAWVDRGLYINANELADALLSMLPKPASKLRSYPPRLRA